MNDEPIVIGIGGNVGSDTELIARFCQARSALGEHASVTRSAPLYRTAPIGPAQAPFLNTAVRIDIPNPPPPARLMAMILEIESALGRTRDGERNGPRLIDLDVLVWGARVLDTPELAVPHPRLAERRFALAPLAALLGDDFEVPGHGRAGMLLDRVHRQDVEQIAETW